MQPTSAPSHEHIAARTRRKWGERCLGKSFVAQAASVATGQLGGRCCSKSSLTFESLTVRGILLTVQGDGAFGSTAGHGIDIMFEAVTAFFGVMSASIFIAHAVDGYRSRS
jgi:hypothetical protein